MKKSSEISTTQLTAKEVSIHVNCGARAYINPWIVLQS
ncbi:hypothetical protein BV097_00859 [Haemophilus influenzae]|nr:hypothetical protein BV094_01248 [Haemophilus influenzae]PRJ57199.1 hypothetical protein BV097_00859 [Haemophilus influenzae]